MLCPSLMVCYMSPSEGLLPVLQQLLPGGGRVVLAREHRHTIAYLSSKYCEGRGELRDGVNSVLVGKDCHVEVVDSKSRKHPPEKHDQAS